MPKGTPRDLVDPRGAALKKFTADPAFIEAGKEEGLAVNYSDAAQSTAFIESASNRCANLVGAAGIKLQ